MKKLAALLLCLCLVLFCTACENKEKEEKKSPAADVLGTGDTLLAMDELEPTANHEKIGYQLEKPQPGEEIAVITMGTGEVIKIRFFPDQAPKAVYNFKRHAIDGYYDGLHFFRIAQGFVLQGGDPENSGYGGESVWGEPFADEFAGNLLNIDGALSMANSGADTNGSQFFINATGGGSIDWDNYDAGFSLYEKDPDGFTSRYGRWIKMDLVPDEMRALYDKNGGNLHLDGYYSTIGVGHTVFGQVFEGMDSVMALSKVPVKSDGSTPVEDVIMKTVEIVIYGE